MATAAISIANARTLRDLEFERVKAQVRARAASPLGRRAIDALRPRRDPEAIERELARVEEMKRALDEGGAALHPGPLDDLEPVLQRTRESSALGGEEFLTVLKTGRLPAAQGPGGADRRLPRAGGGHPPDVRPRGRGARGRLARAA